MKNGIKIESVRVEFVECIPDHLDEGILYVSERFRLCSHKCCCGCGEEVVTPLSPAEWKLTREGDLVSLWPSIGNWDYPCRSHYWIRRNRVVAALPMTERQIARVHDRDRADLSRMIASKNAVKEPDAASEAVPLAAGLAQESQQSDTAARGKREGRLRALLRRLFGR